MVEDLAVLLLPATDIFGEVELQRQFQVEVSMSLSHLFDHEFDSARQLQAHRRYPVELGPPVHAVSDY